jgi:hypothetical protein
MRTSSVTTFIAKTLTYFDCPLAILELLTKISVDPPDRTYSRGSVLPTSREASGVQRMTTILIADDADVCLVIEGSLVFSGFDEVSVPDSTAALARLPAAPVILMTGYYSAGMGGGDSATTILY